jgi:hypothetical protein
MVHSNGIAFVMFEQFKFQLFAFTLLAKQLINDALPDKTV